jgi:hypothetical protein
LQGAHDAHDADDLRIIAGWLLMMPAADDCWQLIAGRPRSLHAVHCSELPRQHALVLSWYVVLQYCDQQRPPLMVLTSGRTTVQILILRRMTRLNVLALNY